MAAVGFGFISVNQLLNQSMVDNSLVLIIIKKYVNIFIMFFFVKSYVLASVILQTQYIFQTRKLKISHRFASIAECIMSL